MSMLEVEVNRLRKEIGKMNSKCEDLEDERRKQEEELIDLRTMNELYQKEIAQLKTMKIVVQENMNKFVRSKVEEEREKFENAQLELTKLQEELVKVTQERNNLFLRDIELESEKDLNDKLKIQNREFAVRLKDDKYMEKLNEYQDQRKTLRIDLKKTQQALIEIRSQAENVIAENKVLRKLAQVPEDYGFDIEDVKIAEQEKLDDYKKQVRFLEKEVQELEEDRTNLRARLRATAMLKGDGSYREIDNHFQKEEAFEKQRAQFMSENQALRQENHDLQKQIQLTEQKQGGISDKQQEEALKQMQSYQEDM